MPRAFRHNILRLRDVLAAAGVAVEVTRRSKRRLFGLKGMAPLGAAVRPPYRPEPDRGRGRPPILAVEDDVTAPPPLPPLTPVERRAFDYSDLDHCMAQMDQAIRQARRTLSAWAQPKREDATLSNETWARVCPPARSTLLEIAKGFAFIGSQHHLEIGGQDRHVDLLFYHRRLRCLVAVDLKIGVLKPEHAGKMNFYLAALDDTERQPGDGPSIGLILCRERNRVVVEYALRNVSGPIGVAEYRVLVADALPAALAEALPTVAEIETGIGLPQGD